MLFVGFLRNSRISFCPFDALFLHPLSTAKASDDARRSTLDHNKAFLLLDASVFTSVPPRSRALSREREREKEITPFILIRPFLRLERKSPRVSSVFFNPHRLFLPQKKEKIIIIERAKILARTKTLLKRVSRTKANEKVFHESARDSLCVDVVLAFGRSVLLRKLFERDNRARESAKEFHSCRRQN